MVRERDKKGDTIRVVRAPLDSLSVFDVTEQELDQLAAGSPSSTCFNFAVFAASIGVSFLATLCTVDVPAGKIFTVFCVVTVIGLLAGLILFVVWMRMQQSISVLVGRIRARAPQAPTPAIDKVPEEGPADATESP